MNVPKKKKTEEEKEAGRLEREQAILDARPTPRGRVTECLAADLRWLEKRGQQYSKAFSDLRTTSREQKAIIEEGDRYFGQAHERRLTAARERLARWKGSDPIPEPGPDLFTLRVTVGW